jgi:hypothetical protein
MSLSIQAPGKEQASRRASGERMALGEGIEPGQQVRVDAQLEAA